jgi:hypothetical protein
MARHIASHPVTVTERDTGITPSRHIRPPIRGGVYVTGAQQSREGRERPRHRQACVDIQQHAFRPIEREYISGLAARVSQRVFVFASCQSPRNRRTNPGPSYGLCGRLIFPCASRSSGKRVCPSHNPLRHNETQRCHHLSADQKDIYARVATSPSTLSERQTPARGPGERRNVEAGKMHGVARPSRPGGGAGGPLPGALAIIDVSPVTRGLPSESFGRSGSEKSGGELFRKSGMPR